MFERLMFRKVELWVVGLICVAAFVGMILVSAIARKTADTAEGNKRFGLVGEAALALSMAPEPISTRRPAPGSPRHWPGLIAVAPKDHSMI